jgi:hypothetical protein
MCSTSQIRSHRASLTRTPSDPEPANSRPRLANHKGHPNNVFTTPCHRPHSACWFQLRDAYGFQTSAPTTKTTAPSSFVKRHNRRHHDIPSTTTTTTAPSSFVKRHNRRHDIPSTTNWSTTNQKQDHPDPDPNSNHSRSHTVHYLSTSTQHVNHCKNITNSHFQ